MYELGTLSLTRPLQRGVRHRNLNPKIAIFPRREEMNTDLFRRSRRSSKLHSSSWLNVYLVNPGFAIQIDVHIRTTNVYLPCAAAIRHRARILADPVSVGEHLL